MCPTKGSRQRWVALSPVLLETLQAHQERQADERDAAGDRWAARDFIFPTLTGTWTSPSFIHRKFKAVVAAAQLPLTTRIHDLRHAMATAWLAAGVPVPVVAERLGHSSPDVTWRIYAHAVPNMQAAVVAAQDERVLARHHGVTTSLENGENPAYAGNTPAPQK